MSLICFSGGCDSTLALYDLATNSSSIWPVHALSVSHNQVPAQEEQRAARLAIISNLRARGFHIKYTEVTIGYTKEEFEIEKVGLIQPHMWLSMATQYLREDEELVMGYIHTDQVIHYKHELFTAFNALQVLGSKKGKLNLPLEWVSKHDVIKRLRDAGLSELVWYCEGSCSPVPHPCGRCESCIKHQIALFQLDELSTRQTETERTRMAKEAGKLEDQKKYTVDDNPLVNSSEEKGPSTPPISESEPLLQC